MSQERRQLDNLRNAYNRQAKTPDPHSAWQKFEPMMEEKSRDRGYILPLAIIFFLIILGLTYGIVSDKKISQEKERKDLTQSNSDLHTHDAIDPVSEDYYTEQTKPLASIKKKIGGTAESKVNRSNELAQSRTFNQARDLSNDKLDEEKVKHSPVIPVVAEQENLNLITSGSDQNGKEDIDKEIFSTEVNRKINTNFPILDPKYALIQHQRNIIPETFNFITGPSLNIENLDPKEKVAEGKISLGLKGGISNSMQKSILWSVNSNIGIDTRVQIAPRFFTQLGIGYSKGSFKTLVNSRDLRVKSIELRSLDGKMESIDNHLDVIDLSIGMQYLLFGNSKVSGHLGMGVSQKWILNQSSEYVMKNNGQTTTLNTSNDFTYRYPIYSTFSSGVNYRLNTNMFVHVSVEYQRILQKTELDHPGHLGTNLGIFINL